MSETASLLRETVDRIFGDGVTHRLLASAEEGAWAADLWKAIEENGLASVLSPESIELGAGWAEAWIIVEAAGRHCVPLPLPETIAAAWLLASAGMTVPEGALALADSHRAEGLRLESRGAGDWRLHGSLDRVPWGRQVSHVVSTMSTAQGVHLICAPASGCAVTPAGNVAGEPRDRIVFDGQAVAAMPRPAALSGLDARSVGALLRSAQIAGALAAVLEHSVSYANDRRQFGRPIGRFQAVQQNLAVLAEESAAASMAAEHAFQSLQDGPDPVLAAAVAKIRAGEAAGRGAAIGHQVHGAMGFAHEHFLHYLTRRLWSWRAEFGAEYEWARRLGEAALDRGAHALWPWITGGLARTRDETGWETR